MKKSANLTKGLPIFDDMHSGAKGVLALRKEERRSGREAIFALRKNRRKLSEACDDVVLQRRFELRLLPHFVRKSVSDLKPVGSPHKRQPPTMASVRSSR